MRRRRNRTHRRLGLAPRGAAILYGTIQKPKAAAMNVMQRQRRNKAKRARQVARGAA